MGIESLSSEPPKRRRSCSVDIKSEAVIRHFEQLVYVVAAQPIKQPDNTISRWPGRPPKPLIERLSFKKGDRIFARRHLPAHEIAARQQLKNQKLAGKLYWDEGFQKRATTDLSEAEAQQSCAAEFGGDWRDWEVMRMRPFGTDRPPPFPNSAGPSDDTSRSILAQTHLAGAFEPPGSIADQLVIRRETGDIIGVLPQPSGQ